MSRFPHSQGICELKSSHRFRKGVSVDKGKFLSFFYLIVFQWGEGCRELIQRKGVFWYSTTVLVLPYVLHFYYVLVSIPVGTFHVKYDCLVEYSCWNFSCEIWLLGWSSCLVLVEYCKLYGSLWVKLFHRSVLLLFQQCMLTYSCVIKDGSWRLCCSLQELQMTP